jgi:hypothetical protein
MLTPTQAQCKRQQLVDDGYCVVDDILDQEFLAELRQISARIREQETQRPSAVKYHGTLIEPAYRDPVYAQLIVWQPSLDLLSRMGFTDIRWEGSMYLINKPPYGPPLYWHQDWVWWDHPISSAARPMQVFLSYYLTDTTVENGCLRVIPGSHLRRADLHDKLLIGPGHVDWTKDERAEGVNEPMLMHHPDAVDVPAKSGSLVIADARLLHSAYANQTPDHRPLVLVWYFLDFEQFPPKIKEACKVEYTFRPPNWWAGNAGDPVKRLVVQGKRTGAAIAGNRVPGVHLRRSGE